MRLFNEDHFAQFVQQYVLERAGKFDIDPHREMGDAHACVTRARAIYFHIQNAAALEAERQAHTLRANIDRNTTMKMHEYAKAYGGDLYGVTPAELLDKGITATQIHDTMSKLEQRIAKLHATKMEKPK